jgi:hypothetical protein
METINPRVESLLAAHAAIVRVQRWTRDVRRRLGWAKVSPASRQIKLSLPVLRCDSAGLGRRL